ncbi:MAG: MCE family protein [Streptosporangiales bacterium]|nr:MCE family protein [Streptosporangiales bacterium]
MLALTRLRYMLYGLIFLVVVSLLIGLSIAIYQDRFTPMVLVKAHTDSAGLQLLPRSDVKVRGVSVGEVRDIASQGRGAILTLSLDPKQVGHIPGNTTARLLPKTVFGEKYVDLVMPKSPSPEPIETGEVITQDRSVATAEITRILDDLMPLLRTLEPQKVNATLTALATALEGNGERIGENLERLDSYLRQLNPHLPTVAHDISALADVSDVYSDVAPDLLGLLRNLIVTSGTVVEKEDTIDVFLRDVTGFSRTGEAVLVENGDRIIQLGEVTRPTTALLAEYSPQLPCFFKGLNNLQPRLEDAFGGRSPELHITLELVKPRPPYKPGIDAPVYGDHRGPNCHGLPNPEVPFPGQQIIDGTEDNPWYDQGAASLPPTRSSQPDASGGNGGAGGTSLQSATMGYAGTAEEQQLVDTLWGPILGTPPDQVPDLMTLLWGPMARGMAVNVE